MPTVQLRKNATIATVRFGGNEPTNTIGITTVITPIGEVVFHVINMSTPFLLCLKDMDRLGAYLNNVTNELICGDKRIPIIKADAPRRFKFTLKDNCDFNYELIVDVERYHAPIRRAYEILKAELKTASAESLLQMAFKSVNDTAGPDGLVPTLLVFEVTVELDNGPAKFRSTAVQPYFRHPDSQQQRSHDVLQQPHADNQTADNQADSINVETEVPKPFEYPEPERPRRRGRPRKVPRDQQQYDTFECAALDLAVKLRAEKKITTAGRPFEASDDLEITNLLGAGVIVPERYDMNKHGKHRLFKSRMVREVKGYGDDEKQINVTTAETNADTALQVNAFGVAALQTDDTLLVGTTTFLQREDRELCFQAKPKKTLREGDTCDFNGSLIALEKGYLLVMQKGQVNNLKIIDLSTEDRAQRYVEQRAHPTAEDFQALNKRIQWQIDNPQRGLRFVPIGLEAAKVFVFTDGSFANNKDLSSQIGFVIIIATETNSTKYSYSLYECLVKLGTTTEKRLMIDIMALRQAYEQREITNIRWINGADNPADAMTKLSPNGALTRFVNDNEITIRLEGWSAHRRRVSPGYITGMGVSYTSFDSPLVWESEYDIWTAGCRCPDLILQSLDGSKSTRLYTEATYGKYLVLFIGTHASIDFGHLNVAVPYQVRPLAPEAEGGKMFRADWANRDDSFAVVVRPDMYIGRVGKDANSCRLFLDEIYA
ncbi:uncharacterized protein HRG_11364 [Hirsutella rhossiliensis]|uniref:Uncharacterized protein n=1 Tax=Hirsutella rhossiliensis TaxID=111463 RepID=A0A9P8MQW7_9HYPO|nr:uncharacterized protein HRG_11364 [Hirsutella rhossiliensis]KAH0957582.1 hypothetical protein HRG_11364 [Hirsutella rhossiliensis]